MAKKQKKNQPKLSKKYLLFFLILIPIFVLTIFALQQKQTYQQQAQTATCGAPGDPGNNLGVGKFCTQGGGQCQGTQAPICAADINPSDPGICSKSCNTNADCGTGAICFQDILGKGCEPVACESTSPTISAVPTSVCLGGTCPGVTPNLSPTQPVAAPPPSKSGGGTGLLQLLLQFFQQIIQFFSNLFSGL